MSLRIIKQGVFDTVQDAGRYGLQHLGINPGGAADPVAYALANMLVGTESGEAVIEMYYPAASVLFECDTLMALSGADFGARLNRNPMPLNTPAIVAAGSVLECTKIIAGRCCYLSVKGGLQANEWAGSYSTNVKAQAGGYCGRKLQTGDVIIFKQQFDFAYLLEGRRFLKSGWIAKIEPLYAKESIIRICKGNEYISLDEASKNVLVTASFTITTQSDRMGCLLQGLPLQKTSHEELVSTGVTRGTIQLLPNGQLMILMADHQTTGGYPRIGHVISADLPLVAQTQPSKEINFSLVDEDEAEDLLLARHQYLQQLQIACNLRLEEFLQGHAHH